jgi:hypothetical protein
MKALYLMFQKLKTEFLVDSLIKLEKHLLHYFFALEEPIYIVLTYDFDVVAVLQQDVLVVTRCVSVILKSQHSQKLVEKGQAECELTDA